MSLSQQALEFDRQHIWHPYENLTDPSPVFAVESAQDVYLHLSGGKKLIDGMASWWSAIHGYNHAELNAAVEKQLKKMSHVMFGGLTHEPAIQLAEKLLYITDKKLDCVFFADSGSVAVEVAMKMALQYWHAQQKPEKNRFLTFRGGYHGDTFAAMSVCDPQNGMHSMFSGSLTQHFFAEKPTCRYSKDWNDSYIAEFKSIIETKSTRIAAVIVEPLVQGAGGMNFYCAEYLRQIHALCKANDVLLIFDELATGFGRTGSMFAYEQVSLCPDILSVGKALTAGYLSLAATLCSRKVAETISQHKSGQLMHGPTYMANPLACAVASKNIDLLLNGEWKNAVKQIEEQLLHELLPCKSLSSVADVRVKGAIGVVELKKNISLQWIQSRLVELGVWLRPFSNRLYIMPPYIIKPAQLSQLTTAMRIIAEELDATA